ncbi:hypothetical protein DAEQUDRAFT_810077 [Daedalea quercina L-15889]|uniref:Ribosomal RNA methyltransferase FtsJ domain-containing protein n=1 Tax=Daedalea quercina L-15889 TaxID=1314783 RepID=A0A165RRA7_9APHY|nr:hypothetical protein DAEQUDRAFT_810077 [Daedalea quercina L-15889]
MDREAACEFKTIADVDRAVLRVLNDSENRELASELQLSAFEVPFFTGSPILRQLLVLKEFYRRSNAVDTFYIEQGQRNRAARTNDTSLLHFEAFEASFREINEATHQAFRRGHVHKFLDLGFAPGGFATWILRTNPEAHGVGISLSLKASGIQSQIDPRFRERFQECYDDVRRVAAGQVDSGIENLLHGKFDLIIANATIMLQEDAALWSDRIHLIYAQILVALQHITSGGSFVISLPMRPFDWVVDIIAVLQGPSFESITTVKPKFQARRSITYLVCQGFRAADREKGVLMDRLRVGIQYLENAGGPVNALSGGTAMLPRLSDVLTQTHMAEQQSFILGFLAPVWHQQYNAIHEHYQWMLEGGNRRQSSITMQASAADTATSWRRQQAPAVQPGGANSPNWRTRSTEPHGRAQRGRDEGSHHGGTGSGTEGSWRKGLH